MSKINDLLLLSGGDIPFSECGVTIHTPTIREISYIGEESFFIGCEIININKAKLSKMGNTTENEMSNFQILLTILNDSHPNAQVSKAHVILVLSLLFPNHSISLTSKEIILRDVTDTGKDKKDIKGRITEKNFPFFQSKVANLFGLEDSSIEDFKPSNPMAERIAKKLEEGRKKAAQQRGEKDPEGHDSMFGRYISILSVGLNKDMNKLFDYTVYQLKDEFKRFELKMNNDIEIQIKLAGGKPEETSENWLKNIH